MTVAAIALTIVAALAVVAVVRVLRLPPHGRGCDCGECSLWHARNYNRGGRRWTR